MMAGFDHARGRVVVSLDGDLQNDPRDIPALLDKLDEGYDLVCGWRQRRQDKFLLRKVPSWVANRIIRRLTGVQITDNGCSLKAYRRDLLDRISLYAEQHRFIPALSASVGARITEMPVRHHARRYRREQVRHLPNGEGPGGSADAEDDHHLPVEARWSASAPLAIPMVLAAVLFTVMAVVAASEFQPVEGRSAGVPRLGADLRRGGVLSADAGPGVRGCPERRAGERERDSDRLGGSLTWGRVR